MCVGVSSAVETDIGQNAGERVCVRGGGASERAREREGEREREREVTTVISFVQHVRLFQL